MCKKQTSVLHVSTASEVISLDAGLRMDGLPVVDVWNVVIEVSHTPNNTESPTQQAQGNLLRNSNSKPKRRGNRDVDELSNVDHVVTNANSSQCEYQLHIFKDNEAVIKMIITSKVERSETCPDPTEWVALDWLFERINLDHKIHVKYVDTKNQLADMLTKGSFTRDAWNHILRLCVQHHEPHDVFLQLFLFEQKAEHHVEENSRKEDGRRVCACLVSRNLSADQSPSMDSGASCDKVFSREAMR